MNKKILFVILMAICFCQFNVKAMEENIVNGTETVQENDTVDKENEEIVLNKPGSNSGTMNSPNDLGFNAKNIDSESNIEDEEKETTTSSSNEKTSNLEEDSSENTSTENKENTDVTPNNIEETTKEIDNNNTKIIDNGSNENTSDIGNSNNEINDNSASENTSDVGNSDNEIIDNKDGEISSETPKDLPETTDNNNDVSSESDSGETIDENDENIIGNSLYQVIFTYDTFEYSILGGKSILASKLTNELGINISFDDIYEILTSNNEILEITKQENDYLIKSIKSFDTEEKLIIHTKNGEEYIIKVTDPAGDVPDHSKTLTPNPTYDEDGNIIYLTDENGNYVLDEDGNKIIKGDGTYKLSLTVTGEADVKNNNTKANVVVILDTSGSMNYIADSTGGAHSAGNNSIGKYGSVNNQYRRLYYNYDGKYYPEGDGPQDTQRHNNVYYSYQYYNNGTVDWESYTGTRYNFANDKTRLEVAKESINELIDTLLAQNNQVSDLVEISFVIFNKYGEYVSPNSATGNGWTSGTNGEALKNLVNQELALDGTNWDDGLYKGRLLANAKTDNDNTYIVFFSDGEPTYRNSEVGSATSHTHGSSVHGNGGSDNAGYNRNAAYYEAKEIYNTNTNTKDVKFYSIFAYGSNDGKTYMKNLTSYGNYGNANHANSVENEKLYFQADNTTAIRNAFKEIASSIANATGIGETSITDGTTSEVKISSTDSEGLLDVDDESFEYYLSWNVNKNTNDNNYSFSMYNGGSVKNYTVSESNGNITITDDSNNVSTYKGSIETNNNVNTLKILWGSKKETIATQPFYMAAPQATFDGKKVDWNLTSLNTLLNGVTYEVTFDVWPSQATYDLIADLKNGTVTYDSLNPDVKKYLKKTNDGDDDKVATYTLLTNTIGKANLTFTDARPNGISGTVGYDQPEPVGTSVSEMLAITKIWNDAFNGTENEENVIPYIQRDDNSEWYQVTLTKDNNIWTGSAYISAGIITVHDGEVVIKLPGHDYSFSESGENAYRWEIDTSIIRPMLINNELSILIREKELATGETCTTGQYEIDGACYSVGVVENGKVSLTATNDRKSNLNIIKAVDGESANEDDEFEFTIVVNDKQIEGTDEDLWFSVNKDGFIDVDSRITGNAWTKYVNSRGEIYYHAPNKTVLNIKLKAGENIRFTNLSSETDFTITESDPSGKNYEFIGADYESVYGSATTSTNETIDVNSSTRTVEGLVSNTNTTYTVTVNNKYELINVNVIKVWDDANNKDNSRPTITFNLTDKDGNNILDDNNEPYTLTLNSSSVDSTDANKWIGSFTGLKRFDENGNEIEYYVKEVEVDGYVSSTPVRVQKDGVVNVTITNKKVIDITVTKVWDDHNDYDSIRPITIDVILTGTETSRKTLSEENSWTYTWNNLPKYDSNGQEINYSISEVYTDVITASVDSAVTYAAQVLGNAVEGFTVKNTHTPLTERTVKKVWNDANNQDGKRPTSLVVTLSDGQTVTLNEENQWTATIEELPVYADGEKISYTWTEDTLPEGYELTNTSVDEETGYITTLTNSYTPETASITVTKIWDDANDQEKLRPKTISVTLLANGKEYETVTLSKDNDWKYTFTDIPVYDDGEIIEYSVSEEVPGAYEVHYEGNMEEGFTIYNILPTGGDVPPTNPQTGDNIILYMISLLISIIGLVSGKYYIKKYNN